MTEISRKAESWQRQFDAELAGRINDGLDAPAPLVEAMRYSALAGGKRMRPLLVYAAGEALEVDAQRLHGIACAIEIIHTYSLIHDDLPAMDDDDLRRGRPTCHRAFDEATAILAGDALQALAFEILAMDPGLRDHPDAQVKVIGKIAHACGASGMAGGQVLDLAAVDSEISSQELETMHRLKTGALIQVSATAPACLAPVPAELHARLSRYGEAVGLAFQVHDDILDVTGNSKVTGKTARADAARNKPTFPSVLGIEASSRRAAELSRSAIAELEGFPGDTAMLEWLAAYFIERDN
jgi:geranylgeranyl pyrophosphate synthase